MNHQFVRELYDSDPEFVIFAKNVLNVNSPDEFVRTVEYAKMQPDSSVVHVPGNGSVKKLQRRKVSKSAATAVRNLGQTAKTKVQNATTRRPLTFIRPPKHKWKKNPDKSNRLTAGVAGATSGLATAGYMQYRNASKQEYQKSMDADVSEFTKVDSDKRQVFGWASITHVNGEPVVDRQGDVVTLEEVEKSAYDYVVKSRVGGSQHKRDGDRPFHAADLIESFVVTEDKAKAMGLGEDVPQGWWVGFKVNDDDTWSKVKNGDVTGFSVHGRGKRQQIDGELTPSEVSE